MYPPVTQFETRARKLALRLAALEAARQPKRRRTRKLSLRPRLARA
jgi:hypothetical protein